MHQGIGFIIEMFGCRATLDRYIKKMKNRDRMKLEHRLPPMILAGILILLSLFWYGWSIQSYVHLIVPNVGTSILGISVISTMV